jgi:hypothetical protein
MDGRGGIWTANWPPALLFIINFFYPAFNGRRVTKPNPWQSATLMDAGTIPQTGEKSGIVFLTVNK